MLLANQKAVMIPYLPTLILVFVGQGVLDEARRIIEEAEITKEDDKNWPMPDRVGRQELEVILGSEHISFTVKP